MENETCKFWVARDKSGELFAYDSKPKRECYLGFWYSDLNCCSISGDLFPELKWQDEPIEVELRPTITDLDIKAQEYADKVTDNKQIKELIINAYKAGYNI